MRADLTALVTHDGRWMQPEWRQGRGPMPGPCWMPLPQLLSAQVVKSYRRRRIIAVKHRVVFGTRETIERILAKRGWKINASFGRRGNTLCKHEAGLRQQWALFHLYHHVVLPHTSLRLLLPDATEETAAGKRWQQRTPAMATGLTERVWSLREVRRYHVPSWPQPQVG